MTIRSSVRAGFLLATASSAALLAGTALAQEAAAPAESELETIVVTGTRLQNPTYTAPTPVAVMSAEIIEERAKPTIGEALSEMPAFKVSTGLGSSTRGTFNAGQAILDLRGLDATRTLVLIDGNRVIPTLATGTFDTNMLPSQMIERVDVVTGGASAAYGADAVAGVVNFIINRRLVGIRGDLRYGVSQRGDGVEYGVNFALGETFMNDRLHLVVGADLSKGEGTGAHYTRDWGQRESDVMTLTPGRPAGTPNFIMAEHVHSVVPAASLVTGCVRGTTPVAGCSLSGLTFDDQGQVRRQNYGSLVGNQSMVGGDNHGTSFSGNGQLKQGYERWATMATATYDFENGITASVDAAGGEFQVHSGSFDFGYTTPNNIRVNRNNPFLPAELAAQMDAQGITQLVMSRIARDVGGIHPDNISRYWRIGAGLRGRVFDDWNWDVNASTGKSKFTYQSINFVIPPQYYTALHAVRAPNGAIVCGPIETNPMAAQISAAQRLVLEPNCQPYNPFGANVNTPEAIDYVSGTSRNIDTYKRTAFSANLAGNVFALPAGDVSLAVGYEYHEDKLIRVVPEEIRALSAASGFWATNFIGAEGQANVHEGYAELGVPLLQDAPLAYSLDLNGAVRHAHYDTHGGATTWKVGATYEPVEWLRFRGTRSHDIRAPTLQDLYVPGVEGIGNVVNPLTGASGTVRIQGVGNPNLEPETSDTTSFGVVFQPNNGMFGGVRLSFDYFDIDMKGTLASIPVNEIIQRFFVGRDQSLAPFVFTDNTALGFSKVAAPLFNLNAQKTNGFDIALNYRKDLTELGLLGAFTVSGNATRVFQLEQFDSRGRSLGNQAGVVTAVPKWAATANFGYDLDRFSTTLTVRYHSRMKYRWDLQGPNDAGFNPALPTSINKNHFPDMAYFSLSASYRVWDNLTVYGVVDNLLDKDPPFGAFLTNGNGALYDAVGRYFRIGLRYRQ